MPQPRRLQWVMEVARSRKWRPMARESQAEMPDLLIGLVGRCRVLGYILTTYASISILVELYLKHQSYSLTVSSAPPKLHLLEPPSTHNHHPLYDHSQQDAAFRVPVTCVF